MRLEMAERQLEEAEGPEGGDVCSGRGGVEHNFIFPLGKSALHAACM